VLQKIFPPAPDHKKVRAVELIPPQGEKCAPIPNFAPNPSAMAIPRSALDLLLKLKKHNNRDWFNAHKSEYLEAHASLIAFADALLEQMNTHDVIETDSGKKSLHRIYRDVRFSKDKTPYHTHWGGSFRRATKKRRGSYYFHLQPGKTFIAAGFWGPNTEDMKRIRQDIDLNYPAWKKLFSSRTIKSTFGELQGDRLKTAPQGYTQDHPGIVYLRYRQFLLVKNFTDREVLANDFTKKVSESFRKMRPFLDHMTEILTTDLNGESLVD
jgi:uncharacterized protein (TIGR02453 family)